MERQKMTKQDFPTETVFSSYQTCLPPDDEKIFAKITIIQFCGFYIFILKTASFVISIQWLIVLLSISYFVSKFGHPQSLDTLNSNYQHSKICQVVIKFPDFSLTSSKISYFPDSTQNSLTFPWPWSFFIFHWLFPDRGNPDLYTACNAKI